MNQDYKIQCYQTSYQELKEIPEVKNLKYPEEKKNLDFSCDIGDIHVEYSMRLGIDFIKIRGEKKYPELTDSQITKIGQQLTHGTSIKFTAYNEMLIFQLSLPLTGIADEDAKTFAISESSKFFNFLLKISKEKDEKMTNKNREKKQFKKNNQENHRTTDRIQVEKQSNKSVIEKSKKDNNTQKTALKSSETVLKQDVSQNKEIQAHQKYIPNLNDTRANESSGFSLEQKKTNDHFIPQKETTNKCSEGKCTEIDRPNANSYLAESKMNATKGASSSATEDSKQNESRRNELEYLITMRIENNKKEAELKKIEAEYEKKEYEFEKKKVELENSLTHLEEEKKKLLELKMQTEEDANAFITTNEKCHKLEEKVELLQNQCDKAANELNKLKEINSKLRSSIAEKECIINNLKEEIQKQEELLKENTHWNESIQAEKDILSQKLVGKEFEIKEINLALQKEKKSTLEKLNSLEDEYKQEINEIQNQYDRKIEELCKQLEEEKNSESSEELLRKTTEYDLLQKEYSRLFSENLNLKEEIKSFCASEKEDQSELIQALKNELSSNSALIIDLQNRLAQYRNNASLGTPDEVLEDFAETRKENRRLHREIEDLKEEQNLNVCKLENKIQELNKVILQKERENESEKEKNTVTYKKEHVTQELASLGIMLKESDNGCLIAKRDGCDILIDPNTSMLQCTTSVSRTSKYLNDILKWNTEELTEMYYCTKKEIICKKKYDVIVTDLQKVLRNMVLLK